MVNNEGSEEHNDKVGSKILVTVPCNHWIHKHVVSVLLKLMKDGRYPIKIYMPSHRPYENNLHHIVSSLFTDEFDFWLSIDSDNPPIQNPLDLVEFDKDIMGFPTPIWHFERDEAKKGERPVYWNAYDYVREKDAYREHNPKIGLQKVDAVGTGCFLIARRVFEDFEMQKAPFARKLYEDGRVHKGNDLSFCERARGRGWEIFAHYDYPCRHYSELELTSVVEGFRKLYE